MGSSRQRQVGAVLKSLLESHLIHKAGANGVLCFMVSLTLGCEWNSHVFSAAGMVGHCVFWSLHVPPRHQPCPSVPAAPGVRWALEEMPGCPVSSSPTMWICKTELETEYHLHFWWVPPAWYIWSGWRGLKNSFSLGILALPAPTSEQNENRWGIYSWICARAPITILVSKSTKVGFRSCLNVHINQMLVAHVTPATFHRRNMNSVRGNVDNQGSTVFCTEQWPSQQKWRCYNLALATRFVLLALFVPMKPFYHNTIIQPFP